MSKSPDVAGAAPADLAVRVFFGDASPAAANVYAQASGDLPPDARLTGSVGGPTCAYARTLAATMPLRDRGPGPTPLAEAIVPDPCFWTPELPYLYQVDVELRRGEQLIARQRHLLGIRPLAVRGSDLRLAGTRWVLRGAMRDAVDERPLAAWHAAGAAMLVTNPDDALCDEASRVGVLVIARLSGDRASCEQELARVARWPAVGVAVLDEWDGQAPRPRNLLLAQRRDATDNEPVAPWADLALCEGGSADDLIRFVRECRVPCLTRRRGGPYESIQEARRACDLLQRDLAPHADPCGFFV
ncbi:MAG: hypothetical protein WDZ59_13565 [Pirellulales bacterium]